MKQSFKTRLIELFENNDSRLGKPVPEDELKKIIRFGVLGELGDNYYLFIYRDFYRNTATYYGTIIFFHRRDELERPITIIGLEQNGKEQLRSVYARAAIFFLKEKSVDTMKISGNAAMVFDMARKKINDYIGDTRVYTTVDLLDEFDFDLNSQDVSCRELEMIMPANQVVSQSLKDNLSKLVEETTEEETRIDYLASPSHPAHARIGLCLVSDCFDLSGEKTLFFQPVIIPVRNDGRPGRPQKPLNLDVTTFEWIDTSPLLIDFLSQYLFIDSHPGNHRLKINLLNHIFFEPLANLLFSLPQELLFCRWDNRKDYFPLHIFKFSRIEVRFAPEKNSKSGTLYHFFLRFSDTAGKTLDARDEYEIYPHKEDIHIIFTSTDDHQYLAFPENWTYFKKVFQFFNVQQQFHFNDFKLVLETLKKIESPYVTIKPEPLKRYELHFFPTPTLNIYPEDTKAGKAQRLEIEFDYRQEMKKFTALHPEKEVCIFRKDEIFEIRCVDILKHDPYLSQQVDMNPDTRLPDYYYYFQENDWIKWLLERGIKYLKKGFKIYSMKWKRFIGNTAGSIRMDISSGIHWLEFKPTVYDYVSGKYLEIDPDTIDTENNMVADREGQLHLVTPKEIEELENLGKFADYHSNGFRIPSRNFILIRRLYDKRMEELPGIQDTLQMEEKLKEFEHIPEYPISPLFHGKLREYQLEGFKWLYFLQDYGFSGCLADDMGLGKTVQTLALLQTLKDNKRLKTSLLILPVSAIPNWESEIEKFTPGLEYHRHIGANRDKKNKSWKKKDLIITSYATLRNDIEIFENFEFDYIILDESQNIKNYSSQVSRAVKILKAKNRLALSGTPIENNSMELWSLFDFLIPGFLGSHQWFNRQFMQPIEKEKDELKIDMLRKMIYPFLLRRKKQDVELELPEKTEIISKLPMEDEQLNLYIQLAEHYRDELDKEIEEKGVGGSSMKIFEAILRLRQVCLFPQLVDEKYKDIASAKFNYLQDLMEDILSENHKVLIFSQFVEVLSIIKTYCNKNRITHSYMDGTTHVENRKLMVKKFQEDEQTRVFLLSLKTGGVALNLTAADYVIIFDPWWNPAVEAQAINRTHRIGQTRKVMAYRMVIQDSIEEKMIQLQEKKKTLMEDLIVSDSESFKNLSKEEILSLFQ